MLHNTSSEYLITFHWHFPKLYFYVTIFTCSLSLVLSNKVFSKKYVLNCYVFKELIVRIKWLLLSHTNGWEYVKLGLEVLSSCKTNVLTVPEVNVSTWKNNLLLVLQGDSKMLGHIPFEVSYITCHVLPKWLLEKL